MPVMPADEDRLSAILRSLQHIRQNLKVFVFNLRGHGQMQRRAQGLECQSGPLAVFRVSRGEEIVWRRRLSFDV